MRDRLRSVKVDLVITSVLKRAVETAEIICEGQSDSIEFIRDEKLNEISWGEYEGAEYSSIKHVVEDWTNGNYNAKVISKKYLIIFVDWRWW